MSFWRTYYHLVWSTKDRQPMITAQVEPRLYAYLAHKAAEVGAFVYAVNGIADHVHLIVAIPPHVSVSQLVKQLKGASSHDLNQQGLDMQFAWQRGYGVLTLGQRQRADAEAYVRAQKEHHGQSTTVASLEYCAELDEGPRDTSPGEGEPVPRVRDLRSEYDVTGEAPF